MVNVLLNNNDIIRGSPFSKKTSLGTPYDGLKEVLESISNNLGNDFILSIAETNSSEVLKGGRILALRDEAKVSGVYLYIHSPMSESMRAKIQKEWDKRIPVFLVHKRMHTIWTRSFKGLKRENNISNLR